MNVDPNAQKHTSPIPTDNANTGSPYDQRGQTLYGDQFNVAGDILGNVILTRLDPADRHNQRNHAVLRQAVRRFWIDGVLHSSLYNAVLIRLGLYARPTAVDNRPWDLILQQPGQPDRPLADDKPLVELFHDMDQQLLILGEPGSGKTTTLLTLADGLLTRTATDPTLPTPVVFNLSTWAERQPLLEEWLAEELNMRYHIPRKVAQTWVTNDELLLLLDGLDEVAEDKRAACVVAINAFRQEHIVAIAVCSRTAEYTALTTRLKLVGAVAVRPLTPTQIEDYITRAGPHVATLRQALTVSPELRDLAQSPLLLSVMTLAYHDQAMLGDTLSTTGRTTRQQLFDRYIQRMFQHRRQSHIYPTHQTLHYLRWLGDKLITHNATHFSLYDLKLSWLTPQSPTLRLSTPIIQVLDRFTQIIPSPSLTENYDLLFPIGGIRWQWQAVQHDLKVSFQTSLYLVQDFTKVMVPIATMFFALMGIIGLFVHDVKWQAIVILVACPVYGILTAMLVGAMVFVLIFLPLTIISLAGGITTSERIIRRRLHNVNVFSWPMALWVACRAICFTLAIQIISLMMVFSTEWLLDRVKSGPMNTSSPTLWQFIVTLSLLSGLIFATIAGFHNYASHILTRWLLSLNKDIPFDYGRFLDFCTAHIFLRRIGNSYMFVHRLLMEHFAELTDESIEQISAALNTSQEIN